MGLKISSNTKFIAGPYTYKEILQANYNDLYNRAELAVNYLVRLQDKIGKMLPTAKRQLPEESDEIKEGTQEYFVKYIFMRSLYAFAEEIWKIIQAQCVELAEGHKKHHDYIEDSKIALNKTLGILETEPFDKLLSKETFDLSELYELLQRFENNPHDFIVFRQGCISWSFLDIMGTIKNDSIIPETLRTVCIRDVFPIKPSIGHLLDDDDNVRAY